MDYTAYVFSIGPNVGLTALDLWLLILCPMGSALGIGVSTVLKKQNASATSSRVLIYWLGQIFIGSVLGLLVALYFLGAITENITSVARIIALCILLGYQAPNIWRSQEKVIARIIEEKIKEAMNAELSNKEKERNKEGK